MVMRIKKVLAIAILGAVATTVTAGELKSQTSDVKSGVAATPVKCPLMSKVKPMPTHERAEMGEGCHRHKNHGVVDNYKMKTMVEAELKDLNVVQSVQLVPSSIPPTRSKIVRAEDHKLATTDTSIPAVDVAQRQYDTFFTSASSRLREVYSPVRYGQYALPADIATMRVGRVKSGVLSNFDMFGKKDKLSVYLFQNKAAMRLYGLYEQRMIAWNNGKAEFGVTVERAINREAKHNFLDTVLTSNATTIDMVKYLDGRLSVKDSDILRVWLIRHKDEAITGTVIDILANGISQQKTDSLFLR